jgi:hypothetical protein
MLTGYEHVDFTQGEQDTFQWRALVNMVINTGELAGQLRPSAYQDGLCHMVLVKYTNMVTLKIC